VSRKLRVNMVSESEFGIKGHGVHSSYIELANGLRGRNDLTVKVNCADDDWADVTHIHTVGTFALRRLLFGRSKKIMTAHVVPDSLVGSLFLAELWKPFAVIYLWWFYNRADAVFAVSEETKRDLQRLRVRRPIYIVHNTIDTKRYASNATKKRAARKKLGLANDSWVVMGAGQVQPRKRVDDFVAAAKQLSNMQFLWVGGMPFGRMAADHQRMQRLIDCAPGNFQCTGVVDFEVMRDYYHAADVFWLPSEQETFGMVVVEAAAAGLPVVLRDIDDYKETFADHALLVEPRLTYATLNQLHEDREYYRSKKKNITALTKKYDISTGAKLVADIYSDVLAK